MTYEDFILSKIPRAQAQGFTPISQAHPSLKPHQRDVAMWMARGGRRACFMSFGLGKTRTHLQVAQWCVEFDATQRQHGRKHLIVAPLGVRHEFTKEQGPAMGMEVTYCRTDAEVITAPTQIVITNYERVRDGDITVTPERFCSAGLDEASVLRSFGSKTYQTFLDLFSKIDFRYVFTATPSPNRHKELIHYGGFLGVMDTGQALTRFFKRNSSKAGDLTLYPHMEEQFWTWLASWAVFMQKLSDLGYDDTGYDLPPIKVHWHCVSVDHKKAWQMFDSWGQSALFLDKSSGLKEIAEVKRETMFARLDKAREIMGVNTSALVAIPAGNEAARVCDAVLHHVENQHIIREIQRGVKPKDAIGICGAGSSAFSWQTVSKGIEYTIGDCKYSIPWKDIKARAESYAPATSRHWLLWHDLEAERELIEKLVPNVRTAYGSQDIEEREEIVLGFSRGEFPILATKPVIAGSGCNFQRHCSDAIFLGSSYKFNDFIQAVHRIQRFQQPNEVNIHIIYSESEDPVVASLKKKWAQHNALVAKMSELLRKFKLDLNTMEIKRTIGCERLEAASEKFRYINNDCVLELAPIDSRHNISDNNSHDRSSDQVAQSPQKGEAGIRPPLSPEKSGAKTGDGAHVVSQEPGEVHSQEHIVSKFASREENGVAAEIFRKASGKDSSQDASLVSQEPQTGSSKSAKRGSKKAIRNNGRGVSGDVETSEESLRDLRAEADGKAASADRSLSQDRQNSGDSVLPLQHGVGAVSGRHEFDAKGNPVSRKAWEDNCVHLIVTSIPFGNQYEYSPSYQDMGHNPSNVEFFKQLDYLIPNLLRVLQPGRIAAIHVKDRIRFGGQHGTGVPTVDRFSDKTADAFEKHGFFFLGRITVDTDVVRENAQTYRLGWSENANDSTKMGVGMPEYVLLFRKPHTDLSTAYADLPVTKDKAVYTRSHWQVDAASFWKSSGNRLPDPEILANMPMDAIGRLWREHARNHGYDWNEHVQTAKELEDRGRLPSSFMLFAPISNHPGIWTDIARMRVLNSEQSRRNEENHVCPLQLDIVNRLIQRYSNPGEIILDPFSGIGTVPYCAIHKGRIGWGVELSHDYWRSGVGYCEQAEREHCMPTLFDLKAAGLKVVKAEVAA